MSAVKWTYISLFLMLHWRAVTGQYFGMTVREGDDVTLSCENVGDDQHNCNGTTWLFSQSTNPVAVELIKLGEIGKNAKSKSDRLSVTANCSLAVKKVTVEDAGGYFCQQFTSAKQRQNTLLPLFVISMTERKDADKATFTCSVTTYVHCIHTVKWRFNSRDVDEDNKQVEVSQTDCSAVVSVQVSHFMYSSRYSSLECEVTDTYSRKEQLFTLSPPTSGGNAGEDAKTTTKSTTTENTTKSVTPSAAVTDASTIQAWWRDVIVSVGLAALMMTVVAVNVWLRIKGNKPQPDTNTVHNDEDEDEGVVSYENVGEPSVSIELR